jgi:hypothetical protein
MSPLQAGCFSALFRRKQVTFLGRARDPPTQGSHHEASPPSTVGSTTPPGLKVHFLNFGVSTDTQRAQFRYITPCDHSYADASTWWLSDADAKPPAYSAENNQVDSNFQSVIDNKLDEISPQLRKLSLDIHGALRLSLTESHTYTNVSPP